mgnify:CR=1 FL=1
MLNPFHLRSLITAENCNSGLFIENVVKSGSEFRSFADASKGIPILVPADEEVFCFEREDVFSLSPMDLCETIYGKNATNYVGFKTSFYTTNFLSSFTVRDEFALDYRNIERQNRIASEHVKKLRRSFGNVGAFQTRNIPHFGHQKIMERMLDFCDHLVVNPVLGPKKIGDATIECLNSVFGDFFESQFDGRISFMPIFSNMYYAGPREAVHHAILRRNMGFTHFSVGRDHAGAEGFYDPQAAPKLMTEVREMLGIEVFCHMGAKYCKACDDFVIGVECGHDVGQMHDVAGSKFREAIINGQLFDYADQDMQRYVFQNVKNIIER